MDPVHSGNEPDLSEATGGERQGLGRAATASPTPAHQKSGSELLIIPVGFHGVDDDVLTLGGVDDRLLITPMPERPGLKRAELVGLVLHRGQQLAGGLYGAYLVRERLESLECS